MDAPRDEELLADYLAGGSHSFELLVRRHTPELYKFLARFTGSATTAEDIVQEAFLQVHTSAATFDPERRFKPWLFTIAANKARDYMRSRSRRPEVPLDASIGEEEGFGKRFLELLGTDDHAPPAILEAEEERERVRRVVDELPMNLREILVLAYFHQFPYREIADILNIPLGTVKSRLHSAVANFAVRYRERMGSEGED